MHTYLCLVSWPPGASTESAPGRGAPNPGMSEASPRATSRLRSGKEESLTATLLGLYKPSICKVRAFRSMFPPASSSLPTPRLPGQSLPLALLVAGHQRPRFLGQYGLDCLAGERERAVCRAEPHPLSRPPAPRALWVFAEPCLVFWNYPPACPAPA